MSKVRWNLPTIPHHARVILRVDANVQLTSPTADFRLRALLPTIHFLQQRNCIITLLTHRGRPQGIDNNLSTQFLVAWFAKQQISAQFATTVQQAEYVSSQSYAEGTLIIVENLRFNPGEKNNDKKFAQQLAKLGDYYVNDAFGVCHETGASLTILPTLFSRSHTTVGFLVRQELERLAILRKDLHNPRSLQRPIVAMLGGGKPQDKVLYARRLLPYVDILLANPLLDQALYHAIGPNPSKDTINKLKIPLDYRIRLHNEKKLHTIDAQQLQGQETIITIGPKTVQYFTQYLETAGTILCNGLPGFPTEADTMQQAQQLLEVIVESEAYTVLAGGDTVTAAYTYKIADDIDYCSTGGGATLAYLAGAAMPALEALE